MGMGSSEPKGCLVFALIAALVIGALIVLAIDPRLSFLHLLAGP